VVVVVTAVIDNVLDLVLAGFFAVNHALTHGVVAAAVVIVSFAMLFPKLSSLPFCLSFWETNCYFIYTASSKTSLSHSYHVLPFLLHHA
jgi:hypothetical protein